MYRNYTCNVFFISCSHFILYFLVTHLYMLGKLHLKTQALHHGNKAPAPDLAPSEAVCQSFQSPHPSVPCTLGYRQTTVFWLSHEYILFHSCMLLLMLFPPSKAFSSRPHLENYSSFQNHFMCSPRKCFSNFNVHGSQPQILLDLRSGWGPRSALLTSSRVMPMVARV